MQRNEYTVSVKRSGAMTLATEPSELTMYMSPYLTEFERRFLVDNMIVKSIEFSGIGNSQIFCRCMIHDLSKSSENQALPSGVPRGLETVLLVHAFHKMTTSWTWIKFATTLYRAGFNVILMDLPGFGRSSVGRDIRCPVEAWRSWEVQIFTTFLAEMKIARVNFVGCYESASIFLSVLMNAPQVLSRNHFLHNPLFSAEQLANPRISGVLLALLTGGLKRRVFSSFDRNRYPDPLSRGQLSLTDDMVRDLLASEQMLKAVSKTVGFNQITIAPVGASDIAEICWYEALDQPGMRPIFSFYSSKKFRVHLTKYLAGEEVPVYTASESLSASYDPKSEDTLPAEADVKRSHQHPIEDSSQKQASGNEYSYGVRIRNMEDQIIVQMAIRESEKLYREQNGDERLLHQQALSDGLVAQTNLPKRVEIQNPSSDPKYIDVLIERQRQIESGLPITK